MSYLLFALPVVFRQCREVAGSPVPRDRNTVARRVSEVLRESCYSGFRSAERASGYYGKQSMTRSESIYTSLTRRASLCRETIAR